ncbi:helix-turn-helix domain-containing protein [Streptomyces sp. ISBFB 2968]|uniref:helix-turn-helix domain-containing protein n=1 Tax=Streptomyces sp. ISBFB 2968 TaxID=2903527 RepID=UPI002FDBBFE1
MTTDHTPSRHCYLEGCDSADCAQANYRYMSALRLDHSRGIYRLRDAAPVLEHIQRLLANGWLVRQIKEASGVSASAIRYVLYGQPSISQDRARAILNIPIGPPPADPTVTDATGTVRRLRALACLGHTLDSITAETGISRWRLGRIITGKFTEIDVDTARRIARTFRRLSTFRADNPHTIRRARAEGWHGPLAWDDIDDPAAKPEALGRKRRGGTGTKTRADVQRVAELTAAGKTAQQIADELGCHKRTVVRARSKTDMAAAA